MTREPLPDHPWAVAPGVPHEWAPTAPPLDHAEAVDRMADALRYVLDHPYQWAPRIPRDPASRQAWQREYDRRQARAILDTLDCDLTRRPR